MNIVIMGAGAIGSLFGGLLSKENNVILVGRKPHMDIIRKHGLNITNKTKITVKPLVVTSTEKITFHPDLIILTVKSYDTIEAVKQIRSIVGEKTTLLSLQNGLDNICKIKKIIDEKRVIAGVTTHGALFFKPGIIKHTGKGVTTIGEIDGQETDRIKDISKIFKHADIVTSISKNIFEDIWIKAIINSSINPLTTIFQCKNGYLLKNPILEEITKKICFESTEVANTEGFNLSPRDMYKKTREVIKKTASNYSSMLQSFIRKNKTEIDSINGKIVDIGEVNGVDTPLNKVLTLLVRELNLKTNRIF